MDVDVNVDVNVVLVVDDYVNDHVYDHVHVHVVMGMPRSRYGRLQVTTVCRPPRRW